MQYHDEMIMQLLKHKYTLANLELIVSSENCLIHNVWLQYHTDFYTTFFLPIFVGFLNSFKESKSGYELLANL